MALREVNLVPPDVMASRLLARHLSFWAITLISSVSLILLIYLGQAYHVRLEQQSLVTLKDIQGHLTGKVELQKRLQGDLEKLNQQKAALYAIKSTGQSLSHVIARLSHIMNDGTWLSQLTVEGGGGDNATLLLTGSSVSNEHLGDFLNRLSLDQTFRGVVLKFANESEGEEPGQKSGKGRIGFQIACQLGKG